MKPILPLFLSALATQAWADGGRRPNLLLFLVDDMGWQDTSVPFHTAKTPFNERYETPHMEALAAEGMVFTQAYASAISSPSRCSLLTGANAARHRVTNWTLRKDTPTDAPTERIVLPEWNYNGIAPTAGTPHTFVATSFVELLRRAGYRTIHCGKAHWGAQGTVGEDPQAFGFEVNIAGHAGGGLATYLGERNYGHDEQGKPLSPFAVPGLEKYWGTGTFVTEALTQEAIGALAQARREGKPFFLNMSHYGIHVPIDRDRRFFAHFKKKGLSDKEAAYASLIAGVDKSLGDLVRWLKEAGEWDNTILLFMSDNGPYTTGEAWRDAPLYTHAAPLRCGKGSAYEGGVREPMIVRWKGVTPAGSRTEQCVAIEDFFPTILEMAGVRRYKTVQETDGVSFVPTLRHPEKINARRALYWNTPNRWENDGPGIGATCAIRQGDWKLIYFYETGRKELYNLRSDIGETRDFIGIRPDIARRLSKKLSRFLRRVDAQRPTFRDSGKPCPFPDEL